MNPSELVQELERRQKEEKLRYFYAPDKPVHWKQFEWHKCQKRNKWTLSGNRTGKTVGGAIEMVVSMLGESARKYIKSWQDEFKQAYEPMITRFKGHSEAWVVSVSNEVQRDVAQKELLKWLPKNEIASINAREGKRDDPENAVLDFIVLNNGNTIGFKSVDQGRTKFQGTSKKLIWFDEEPPKEIYDECMMRTLDCQGYIIGTMTPLLGLTFVYDDIYLNETKPIANQDPEIHCAQWSWEDNPYLDESERARLEGMYTEAELEARKRGHFIMPGACVFDKLALLKMQDKCYPGERGNLIWDEKQKKVTWDSYSQGEYEVWFHPYTIDADGKKTPTKDEYLNADDVAEGLEHGDYSVASVINRTQLRLDAVWHGHIDADVFGDRILRLQAYYNIPLLVPERNKDGAVTVNELKKHDVTIYRTMVFDKEYDEERETIGWLTTPKTRPFVVNAIKKAVREGYLRIYWRRFVDEAMNFIRHPDGKEAARSGYWDDVIMMMGIGMHVHETSPLTNDLPAPKVPGGKPKEITGWKSDGTFLHPSILEDRKKAQEKDEWAEEDW
jgi:phage terminase large subunit-like protein